METTNPFANELKDPRLKLIDSFTVNGIQYLTFYLEPKDKRNCPKCQSTMTTKDGLKQRRVNIQLLVHTKTEVIIKYHRFRCNKCGKLFVDKCEDIERNKSIAKLTKLTIMNQLKEDVSLKKIAKYNNVSESTVIKILNENIKVERLHLPDTICVDEFKNLKSADGKYAFLIYSPLQHKIIDVLETRNKPNLESYFYNIDFFERNNVKYFVSDMYEEYRTIANVFFPNATQIIDSFHYIRYVTGAFQTIRINIQKEFPVNSKEYNMLKNHWRLLSIDTRKLKDYQIYNYIRKKPTSSSEYINDALSISLEFKKAYEILQEFYYDWKKTKYEEASNWIDNTILKFQESGFEEYDKVATTFKNWNQEIINSFIRFGDKRLNNEYIEGMNNRIKEIKKIGYGYKNFEIFKKRIMYIINGECTIINK